MLTRKNNRIITVMLAGKIIFITKGKIIGMITVVITVMITVKYDDYWYDCA